MMSNTAVSDPAEHVYDTGSELAVTQSDLAAAVVASVISYNNAPLVTAPSSKEPLTIPAVAKEAAARKPLGSFEVPLDSDAALAYGKRMNDEVHVE